jgi:hypothetical protein
MRKENTPLIAGLLLVLLSLPAFVQGVEVGNNYVYVAPNAVQAEELGIFTTITLTNTTKYWFNPRIYLIDPDGEIIIQLTPLLKSFGTWQKASVDIVTEDFRGSVWVVSPQPIVSASFIHQFSGDGSLSLLGNTQLERINSAPAPEWLNPDN